MPVTVFHTADLHLGMKFTRGYAPDVREALIEARFSCLENMVKSADERKCDLFVIAGDFFHSTRVPKKDVIRAAEILRRFSGRAVIVLPGNHDFFQSGADTLWAKFMEAASDHTVVLDEQRPYDLEPFGLPVTVYPGPCRAKHSKENAVGWVAESMRAGKNPEHLHLGAAHGSLQGLSPDFNEDYHPMSIEELTEAGPDLWLMGHTHVRYPDEDSGTGARIFFPSTPEPDGFDCRHAGFAWLIELGDDRTVRYRSVRTGQHRFVTMTEEIKDEDDIERLKAMFPEPEGKKLLVKLKLIGRAPGEIHDARGELIQELNRRVLHLEADMSELVRRIAAEDIDREFTQGSFPHRFLSALAENPGNPLSLQTAYDLIKDDLIKDDLIKDGLIKEAAK